MNAHGQALIIDYKHKGTNDLKAYSAKVRSLDSELSKRFCQGMYSLQYMLRLWEKQLTKYEAVSAVIYLGTKSKDKPSFALAGMATEAAAETHLEYASRR